MGRRGPPCVVVVTADAVVVDREAGVVVTARRRRRVIAVIVAVALTTAIEVLTAFSGSCWRSVDPEQHRGITIAIPPEVDRHTDSTLDGEVVDPVIES